MTLIDTGPLLALLNRRDAHHALCSRTLKILPRRPLLTTWACFAEAMHLLKMRVGYRGQADLWALRSQGFLALHAPADDEIDRMAELMDRYHDLPMDLADASLVAAAERLGVRTLFTLDADFRVYQLADGSALELVPATHE